MAVRYFLDYFLAKPFSKFHHTFLVAGRAEMATLARKGEQIFMFTVLTSYSCKSIMGITTIKIPVNHLSHIWPKKPYCLSKRST
jgi:hypothetical protein